MASDHPWLPADRVPRPDCDGTASRPGLGAHSLVMAALIGLAAPASPTGSTLLAVPLCGGGSGPFAPGGKRLPGGDPGACHAACASRRSDHDGEGRPGADT